MLDIRRVVSIAFIGKNNDLTFFYTEEDSNESLHLQMLTHSALDVIEERKSRWGFTHLGNTFSNYLTRCVLSSCSPRSATGSPTVPFDAYLGHLFNIDNYKLFGSSGNISTKIVVICEAATPDNVMKDFFATISSHYYNALKNPFQPIGQTVMSNSFLQNIKNAMQTQNQILLS